MVRYCRNSLSSCADEFSGITLPNQERVISNGHTAVTDPLPARTSERPRDQPAEGFNQASGDLEANGENGPTSTGTPRRPISPLGRGKSTLNTIYFPNIHGVKVGYTPVFSGIRWVGYLSR